MKRQLFIYGSGRHTVSFIKYIATCTGKLAPNICFIPTASGDDPAYIQRFYDVCRDLPVIPHVLPVWINSYDQKKTFEEVISSMDAIVVGGGNTLNMLAIWKAQGIDVALKNAYMNGVVMGGGSAGSLCWFNGGTTDARPVALSIVKGLSIINKSHCPHYNSEKFRRPLYHNTILKGKLTDGYACDDGAAIHFIDEEVAKAVSLRDGEHAYYVSIIDDNISEKIISSTIL